MSNLLKKCKSSINGSFQRLYLIVLQNKQQSIKIIIEAIPYLKNHQELLKMWSVRHYAQPSQINISSIPSNNAQNFGTNPLQLRIPNTTSYQNYETRKVMLHVARNDDKNNINDQISLQMLKNNNKNKSNTRDAFDLFKEIDCPGEEFD